jgi:hypothetical protein
MKNTMRKMLVATGTGVLLAGLGACSQTPTQASQQCELSGTSNVDQLFAEVGDKLQDRSCHYSYPRYRDQLLSAAKGAPGPENEARFAGLLRATIDEGVISKRQAQALFSQYFDAEFYVVKDEARSSCSSLRQKEKLYAGMRTELAYKREGMLEILDDKARFREAQQHFSDLQLVLDAVEVACMQDV